MNRAPLVTVTPALIHVNEALERIEIAVMAGREAHVKEALQRANDATTEAEE
jgi:hypothetical protein